MDVLLQRQDAQHLLQHLPSEEQQQRHWEGLMAQPPAPNAWRALSPEEVRDLNSSATRAFEDIGRSGSAAAYAALMRRLHADGIIGQVCVWGGDDFADADEIWVREGAVGVSWGGEGWGRWGWWGGLIRWGRGLGERGRGNALAAGYGTVWLMGHCLQPLSTSSIWHLPLYPALPEHRPAPATCALNSLFLALRP